MLSNWFGVFREQEMKMKPAEEDGTKEVTKSQQNFKTFLKQPETQKFINEWNSKIVAKTKTTGKALVIGILELAYAHPGMKTDYDVRNAAHSVLNKFAGEGRLDAIAKGFKAAPEKILKGIKDLLKKAA